METCGKIWRRDTVWHTLLWCMWNANEMQNNANEMGWMDVNGKYECVCQALSSAQGGELLTRRAVQEPLLVVSLETGPSFNPVLKSRKPPNMSDVSCRFSMILVLSLNHGPKGYLRTSQDPRNKNDSSLLMSTTLATSRNSQPLAASCLLNLSARMSSYVNSS